MSTDPCLVALSCGIETHGLRRGLNSFAAPRLWSKFRGLMFQVFSFRLQANGCRLSPIAIR
jgi:hypothetical protein